MLDLASWIADASDARQRHFREATQLVLRAIARSPGLAPIMIMKGGILLAVRHGTGRTTTDIDFSTTRHFEHEALTRTLDALREALGPVAAENEHDLALQLQSHELKPRTPQATFPTLAMRIGYASRANRPAMARLAAGQAADIVSVDYSFNEWASDAEDEPLDGGTLRVYPFEDLVAEKLRSLLQQPGRRRARYQDLYDLTVLLASVPELSDEDRATILAKLRAACADRVALHRLALSDPEVRSWTAKEYDTALPGLLRTPPPPFEEAFRLVLDFFESLPW